MVFPTSGENYWADKYAYISGICVLYFAFTRFDTPWVYTVNTRPVF